jgi:hypothetical protein
MLKIITTTIQTIFISIIYLFQLGLPHIMLFFIDNEKCLYFPLVIWGLPLS